MSIAIINHFYISQKYEMILKNKAFCIFFYF